MAQALREASGSPLTGVEQAGHERDVAVTRAALDAEAFAAAWVEGAATPLEAAIATALEESGDVTS